MINALTSENNSTAAKVVIIIIRLSMKLALGTYYAAVSQRVSENE